MLMWMGIYFGISLVIFSLFEFPLSLITFIVVFFFVQLARAYLRNRKSGGMNLRGLFNSSSSTFGFKRIKYYCMNCGTPHNQRDCPNCGSRMKKVG
jgi:hypothetical protein